MWEAAARVPQKETSIVFLKVFYASTSRKGEVSQASTLFFEGNSERIKTETMRGLNFHKLYSVMQRSLLFSRIVPFAEARPCTRRVIRDLESQI